MGGQTSYQNFSDIAVPGMRGDLNLDDRIDSFPAGEAIPFGRLCEVNTSGQALLVRGALLNVAANKIAGVSVLDVAREQQLATTGGSAGSGFYNSGDMVPLLRKGRIYGAWDNSTTALSQGWGITPNVNHPSTTDPLGIRGVFSGASASSTAGSEVSACPAEFIMVKDVSARTPRRGATGTNNWTFVALLEVNLPGA